MTEDSTEVTAQVDTPATTEDRFEVETNIATEPAKEVEAKEVQAVTEPTEEPQEKKSINPRTLARKAEKERTYRELGAATERNKQLEAELAKYTQSKPEAKRESSEEPNILDYDDVIEYTKDMIKFEARQTYTQETSKLSKQNQMKAFSESAEVLKAEKPDFDEKLSALRQSGLIEPQLEEAIFSSNMSAEVAYHLAQYPSDIMTLRGLPADMLPTAMKQIEAFIKKGGATQEAPRVTKAQPPITPPGANTKTDRSLSSFTEQEIADMPLSEFNKRFDIKRY